MSLKAKLEAVIYAAEEPVTLAQLARVFTEDAFAWNAERNAGNRESAESLPRVNDPLGIPDSTLELAELVEAVEGEVPSEEPAQMPGAAAIEASSELEAQRAERKRDREVREILREILDELIAEYSGDERGIEIREIAGGFRMATKPQMHDGVRAFVKSLKPPMKLSLPALETLAVVAYKQPVTAPEVGEIRGVESAGVLGSLLSRKLIATAGRKQVIGRPILYKTTKEFLLRFGLKDLSELPSMEEFEKLAAMELNEEPIEEEDGEKLEPIEESGDLFAQVEEISQSSPSNAEAHASGAEVREISTPAAEVAAAYQTPVERLDEIEVGK